ncbi:AfsR/SARP family transcriptional regulator [Streptomyces sp. NPDC047315]|uniref:AfsR/SARP family transcriptional regulator n=1 Tax=Streptomyces sp. NPDC047315 TaxID=3155142 RepID=UPI003409FBD7
MRVLDRAPAAPPATTVEFRLLGPVGLHDLRTGRFVTPAGAKQRALLCALVCRAGEPLGVDVLVEELWGEEPPANAVNALQAHATRLRRLLPPSPTRLGWIRALPTGYLFALDGVGTDAARFERLSAQGRSVLPVDPGRAVELLRLGLSLWQGPALRDSGQGSIGRAEADRLEEQRLTALEALHEAGLACGRHGEITGELERLTEDHPVRERFYDLLMVALYRSGRQAEALGTYERARRHLVGTLGIEPGPALRSRMEAVLRHSPELAWPPSSPLSVPADVSAELLLLRQRVDELSRSHRALAARLANTAGAVDDER